MKIKQMAERLNSVPVRKKAKRLLAITLAVLMVNPVTGYGVTAHAQEAHTITAFSKLSGKIASQQLAVGAEESDINLPDTLNVTVGVSFADTTESIVKDSQPEEIPTEEVKPDESNSEEPVADESPADDSSVSGNDAEEPQEDENGAEDNTATDSQATVVLDSGEVPLAASTTGSAISADSDDGDTEQTETETITSEERTLTGITWQINAERSGSDTFDSANAGAVFFYEPVLPEGYTLADGVSLPQIQVKIEEKVQWAFSQSQTIDGIEITVKAEKDVFPEGAVLHAEKVTNAEDKEKIQSAVSEEVKAEDAAKTVTKLVSFDITITDAEGNELQPDTSKGEVRVSFAQLPMVTEDTAPTQELKVFHMDDSLSEAKGLDTTMDEAAGALEAPAEHFSLYTVALLKSGAGTPYDISNGALIINSSNLSTYDNATITGTISNEAEQLVIDGVTVNLFIEDLSITITGYGGNKSGIALKNGAILNLTVKGTNALTGEYGGAGIHVPQGCTLNITEESTGTLTATGGNGYGGGAGIGAVGNQWNVNPGAVTKIQSVGTINIAGGIIIAKGGTTTSSFGNVTGSAGIGGSTESTTGDILISGGTVTATGGYASAGIGGGHSGCVDHIRITGGTVTATSGDIGSAIGSGYNGTTTGTLSSGTIEITGGDVTANGNIGYGEAAHSENNVGGMVSIAAGAAVKINGGVISPKAEGVNNYPISVTIYDGRLTSTIENASLTIEGKTYQGTLNVSEPCVGTFNLTLAVQGTLTGTQVTTISGGGYSWEDITLSEDSGGYSKEIGERLYPVYLWLYDPTITADIAGVTISAKRNGISMNGNDNQEIMQLSCDGMIVKQQDGIGKMTAWMTAGMDTELSVTASSLNDGNAMSMSNQTVNASASGTLIILHDNAGIPQLSQPLDLSFGSITFTENGGRLDITYTPTEGGTPTTVAGQYYENEFEIVQTNNTASTTNQIIFQNTTDFVKVKLNGVNILSQGKAIDLQLSKVQLSLVGTNTIDCGGGTTSPANYYSGIHAREGSALTVDGSGSLSITNPSASGVGIGGDHDSSKKEGAGTIRIEGGSLTVYSKGGAGIGSSYHYHGDHPGSIIITGGTVNAYSNDGGAAIGGGEFSKPASVHISGGIVTASNTSKFGTAIGGGYYAEKYGSIKISGGIVTAQNDAGIAIGAGQKGTCPDIEISGGTVIANSIGYGTQGSGEPLTITGGTIHTADGGKPSINVATTNGSGKSVYYTKADVSEIYGTTAAVTNASITDCTYGFTDVKTDSNGILHLFLPESAAAAKTMANFNGVIYAGTVTSAESNSLKRNIPLQVSKGTITSTGATLNVTANTGNTVYYVASSTELSEGSEVASASGAQSVAASGGTNVITLSGLSANTGYTYYLTAKEGAAYSDVVAVSFTTVKESIVDATVTLTDCDSFTYDGTAKTPTVTVKLNGNTLSADQYEVSYSNSNGGAGNHTSAGTVTVTVTASSEGNYAGAVSQTTGMTYIIAKADQSISITEVDGKKYKDADFTLEATGGSGTGAVTFSVPEGNSVLSVSGNTATIIGVGTVTVTAIKAEDTNYNEATATQAITIEQADTSIALQSSYTGNYFYTGSPISNPAEADLSITGASYSDVVFTWYDHASKKLDTPPTATGSYILAVSIPETANTKPSSNTKSVTISSYDGTVTFAYNGNTTMASWYSADVPITADGYTVSDSVNGTYADSYLLSGEGEVSKTLYFKQNGTGYITDGKTITVNIDKTAPTFSADTDGITISDNNWKGFLNNITFGHFFKENKDGSISATDSGSGGNKYYYYIDTGSTTAKTAEELKDISFTEGSSFSITDENKYIIYAYAVDQAGNKSAYICTDGIVIDKTAPTVTLTAPAGSDLGDVSATAKVQMNETGIITYVIKTTEQSGMTAQNILDAADKKTVSVIDGQADTNLDVALSGLTANDTYYMYAVGTDSAENNGSVVNRSFTTTTTKPIFADNPTITGTYGQQVKDMTVSQVASTNGVAGSWSVSSTDIPSVGTSATYDVVFTPDNAAQYATVTVQVTPTVNPKSLTAAGVIIGEVTGTYTYNKTEKVPTVTVTDSEATITASDYEYSYSNNVSAGTATVTVTAKGNYTGTVSRTFTIEKAAAPSITWPNASSIIYGQKLSASALSVSSTEYGTFAWTDGSTVPTVTNGGYEVTFTPNAGTVENYEAITNTTKMVAITVSKATPAVTVSADISDDAGSRKATLTATVTGTGDGETPTGTIKFVNSTSGSDADIAGATAVTITGGKATYTWTGLTKQIYKVKAVYNDSANYNTATSTELSFDTNKQNQAALNIGSIGTKTYGDGTFTLSATGGSGGGAVTFESSDPSIVSISGTTATIHKVGTVTITTTKAANNTYNEVTASVSLTVGKKTLSVKANDQLNIIKGAAMPELTYTATGLVGSDTFTSPSISTTATDTNTVGEYDITISGGTLANADSYAVTYTNGKLTVVNATYTVTVTNGTGGSSYSEGQTVTITADSRGGYTFTGWSSSDGVTFANSTASTTTFTMPGKAVTVTANYSKNSSGDSGGSSSGGSSSGGSSTSTTTTTPEKKPNQPVTAAAPVTATAGTNGAASASIPDKTVTDAIAKAQSDAKAQGKTANGISVELDVTMPKGTASLTATLTRNSLDSLVSAGVSSLEINGSLVQVSFDKKALTEIQKQSSGNISIAIAPKTNLSDAAKKLIGTRPVYDITVGYGSGKSVANFGGGVATVSIPYTLGKNEAVGGLYAVYVDAKGNANRIAGSAYDTNSGCVIFTTTHFSQYGIGYTAPTAKFTDISTHWAKESVDYVVGRGLLSGTSDTAFSPNSAMTRGMLVTALGRLAGVDTKAYTGNSFTDVNADSAYRPYIEWAYSKGIIQGIGGSQFAPDRAITREEIAVIFTNYAKATGYTLPITREATTYADASSIGSAYKDAVKAMQQAGIMMGGSDNKFNPKGNATRAEVSSMLNRYIKLTINPDTAQGWTLNDAGQYLYYKDGKALAGTQTIDSVKYFFNTDGTLKTGWVKDGDNWRFYSGKTMLVGFWDLGANGNNKTYYFTKDGLMVSGKWLEIDGKWYYFYTDGSLARSTKIDGYEVDEKGVRKTK